MTTIICKKLNQPLILGYVIAGFLISPALDLLPDIGDSENIETWADIGIVFLMFGLGLEFSIVKLTTVGKPAIITALTEMVLMISAGIVCGLLLGWNFYTCLFLGGMLAISSTTIIIKALEEMNLMGKKFTQLVFGSLVIEDIAGIFLMVLLSTIAVGSAIDGGEIVMKIGNMSLYLVLWFVLSIIFVPTLLKRIAKHLNNEIMLVVSVALCFVMVVLAHGIGFSLALGAFIAGSILAGTTQAEKIEELTRPVKDLFGAVFFVSVGMMVSPGMIIEHIVPIVVIAVVTLIGKPIFTSLGALLSGQSLKTSVQSGLCLSQIGEFSFIIAGLGVSLGVTADYLYPVIVAVSVITTLSTPFFIRSSDKVYSLLNSMLPDGVLDLIDRRSQGQGKSQKHLSMWRTYLKRWMVKLVMMVVAALATSAVLFRFVRPFLNTFIPVEATELIITVIAVLVTGIFIANLFYNAKGSGFKVLWLESRKNQIGLIAIVLINVVASVLMLGYLVNTLEGVKSWWIFPLVGIIVLVFANSRWLYTGFLEVEKRFIGNLNERILVERQQENDQDDHMRWVGNQLFVTHVIARSVNFEEKDIYSSDLFFGHAFNLDLIAIMREDRLVGEEAIMHLHRRELRKKIKDDHDSMRIVEGDELVFMGTHHEVNSFLNNLEKYDMINEEDRNIIPLSTYLDSRSMTAHGYDMFVIRIHNDSKLRGKTIAASAIKEEHGCFILGLEHDGLPILKPDSRQQLKQGDYVWLLGNDDAQAYFEQNASVVREIPPMFFDTGASCHI